MCASAVLESPWTVDYEEGRVRMYERMDGGRMNGG